jgi:hypothetical protein
MKLENFFLPGLLSSLVICGSASSHNISGDGWNGLLSSTGSYFWGTGTSISVNPQALPEGISLAGITSLSFSPGTGASNPATGSYEINTRVNNNNPFYETADEWEWSGAQNVDAQAVDLIATSLTGASMLKDAPVLTVSVGYADAGFGCTSIVGEIASVSVNGVTYTAKNPCSLASGSGDLTFIDGVLKPGTGIGWTESTSSVSAPEIDPRSAVAGLGILLGGLMVLRGRPAR